MGRDDPRYEVTTTVLASVTVRNPDVIERVTGPGGDEWRSQFYDFHTATQVVEHFAFNAITNGVLDITRLEGWADCVQGDALIEIEDTFGSSELAWPPEGIAE